jgi:hypothetical protein
LPRFQVRSEEDTEHRNEIRQRIEDAGGNTDKCSPIVIYEKRHGGNDIVGDGNHTLGAAKDAKHCSEIPVIRIPEQDHIKYTGQELRGVSNLLNKKPEIIKKSMSIDDGVKYIIGTVSGGAPVDSKWNKAYLEACGFTKHQINNILKKARNEIDKNNLSMANLVWIDYKSKTHEPALKAKTDNYKDKNTIAMSFSSGMFKWDTIINTVFAYTEIKGATRIATKTNIVLVVYHPNKDAEDKWIEEYRPAINHKLKYFLAPMGYTFSVVEMPTTLTNNI